MYLAGILDHLRVILKTPFFLVRLHLTRTETMHHFTTLETQSI